MKRERFPRLPRRLPEKYARAVVAWLDREEQRREALTIDDEHANDLRLFLVGAAISTDLKWVRDSREATGDTSFIWP